MSDILTNVQVISPDMSSDYFLMFLTFSAKSKHGTGLTNFGITLVFTVAVTIGGTIS